MGVPFLGKAVAVSGHPPQRKARAAEGTLARAASRAPW